jgi:hypothetical protein
MKIANPTSFSYILYFFNTFITNTPEAGNPTILLFTITPVSTVKYLYIARRSRHVTLIITSLVL